MRDLDREELNRLRQLEKNHATYVTIHSTQRQAWCELAQFVLATDNNVHIGCSEHPVCALVGQLARLDRAERIRTCHVS